MEWEHKGNEKASKLSTHEFKHVWVWKYICSASENLGIMKNQLIFKESWINIKLAVNSHQKKKK